MDIKFEHSITQSHVTSTRDSRLELSRHQMASNISLRKSRELKHANLRQEDIDRKTEMSFGLQQQKH